MSSLAPLQCARAGGVTALILDRPAVGHALSAELVAALDDAIDTALSDPTAHTLVLMAAGKHFCTGFDLTDLEQASDADLMERFIRIELLLQKLWHAPVQTVAIAQGRCWGAGADLFAACDQRVLTAQTTLRFPGAAFGIVLGSRRLALRVGPVRARALIAGGMELDASTAVHWGLATELIETPLDLEAPADPAARLARWSAHLPPPPVVDRPSFEQIRKATLRALDPQFDASSDGDLAALVRSAARPGLRDRLVRYRERVRSSRAKVA
ncbi:MAG: hypothetical protein RL322_1323 [Pseudomonadota bacterium]|jgi:enoyl-CoA hydratase/carnithine racemase